MKRHRLPRRALLRAQGLTSAETRFRIRFTRALLPSFVTPMFANADFFRMSPPKVTDNDTQT